MLRVQDLPLASARRVPGATALTAGATSIDYRGLADLIEGFACALVADGLGFQDRVAILAEKSIDAVAAMFGAMAAGGVMVPINPLLKDEQVAYILRDCDVAVLVTTPTRLAALAGILGRCPALRQVVVLGDASLGDRAGPLRYRAFPAVRDSAGVTRPFPGEPPPLHRTIDSDLAAILYTSGSTGGPKGVVLTHRNLVLGAQSVASYLDNRPSDRILALLPFSFDYGFSQLTTAFLVGAGVVLHNYLLAGDVVRVLARERITGLAAVPPLWLQLIGSPWPAGAAATLRYFTNSGGAMPTTVLATLRERMPSARPFLMYGLTEAFRSTYLSPDEVDRRPTSIGKAIPGAEILVLRPDGSPCEPDEPGELVHRGGLVALGYWNDPARTAERFRPLPPLPPRHPGVVLPELAVWSGDTVLRDEAGFLYFVSRRDEMIKCSGYRISPTEVEEAVYRTGLAAEVAALGIHHPSLGQAIVLVAQPMPEQPPDSDALIAALRDLLPGYMVPARIDWLAEPLPRTPNGKVDRKRLATERDRLFMPGPGSMSSP